MAKILIIDDDVDILSATKLFLKRHFEEVSIEKKPEKLPFLLNNYSYDLILLDMNFTQDVSSGKEGFHWLDRILDLKPDAKVVLFTAYGDVEMAVKSIKLGAKDFVLKPWDNQKLLNSLLHALAEPTLERAAPEQNMIGESTALQQALQLMNRVAKTDANVLILGENGTGKDLMAKALHQHSGRYKEAFIRADIASLPETLLESELFGHEKGAFTDAKTSRIGKFEEANKGTLFLDEIGNLPLTTQRKLLTTLQNRTVVRLGQNKETKLDIRLICATNEDIAEKVSTGAFREDLFYRINTVTIEMPPLRSRKGDIALLAQHFLGIYNKKYNRNITDFSAHLKQKMELYPWPGNIRELQHAVERAVILCQNNLIDTVDLFGSELQTSKTNQPKSYDLEEVEKQLITEVMQRQRGNISESAKELGLSRAALYRRIEKYAL
ncbi:DNA-binding NtrC family response regulator [Dyadobacter jejuensis]|uniref:DNA-binding NtrC family response regulator n=1 Tax=Dyadobacter jejuensis TaxID=1082580 RepID=A0A316A7K1_9BACT|nr:sigma-54 dependent transcriptional regulator [Dyadobacter jejuensis]PWJ53583.1 DNA-binding NtrC family response regulator [Dyadobacter jejuensis]